MPSRRADVSPGKRGSATPAPHRSVHSKHSPAFVKDTGVLTFGASQWKDMQATVQALNEIVCQGDAGNPTAVAAAEARGMDGAIFGGMFAEEINLATQKDHMDHQGEILTEMATRLERTAANVSSAPCTRRSG